MLLSKNPALGNVTQSRTALVLFAATLLVGGSFTTLLASNVAKNSAVSVTRPGGQHASSYFKAVAKHTGYTASAKGAAGSIGPVPSGTLC